MPFAFSQIDPETTGQTSDMEVPLSTYLGKSLEAGEQGSILHSALNFAEITADNHGNSKLLSPDDANKQYGLSNLRFDQPVREATASAMRDRRQAELDRDFFLSQDNHSIAAGVAGMGAQMVGSLKNPVDMAALFLPFVGEEAGATDAANVLGRGALRRGISRGLITHEAVSEAFPAAPQLAKSVIQGMAYQSMSEVPIIANRVAEGGHPGLQDLEDVGIGGAFAAAMHVGISGAASILKKLGPEVHETLSRKAMSDFAQGRDVDVKDQVRSEIWYSGKGMSPDLVHDNSEAITQGTTLSKDQVEEAQHDPTVPQDSEIARVKSDAESLRREAEEAMAAEGVKESKTYQRPPIQVPKPEAVASPVESVRQSTVPEPVTGPVGDLVKRKGQLGKMGYYTVNDPRLEGMSARITKDEIELIGLYVKDKDKGQGIGSQVIDKLKEISERDNKPITTIPRADDIFHQSRLEKFYAKHGFKDMGDGTWMYSPVYYQPTTKDLERKISAEQESSESQALFNAANPEKSTAEESKITDNSPDPITAPAIRIGTHIEPVDVKEGETHGAAMRRTAGMAKAQGVKLEAGYVTKSGKFLNFMEAANQIRRTVEEQKNDKSEVIVGSTIKENLEVKQSQFFRDLPDSDLRDLAIDRNMESTEDHDVQREHRDEILQMDRQELLDELGVNEQDKIEDMEKSQEEKFKEAVKPQTKSINDAANCINRRET